MHMKSQHKFMEASTVVSELFWVFNGIYHHLYYFQSGITLIEVISLFTILDLLFVCVFEA